MFSCTSTTSVNLPFRGGRERKVHRPSGGDRWPPAPSAGWSLGLRLSWVTGARHRAMAQGHWICGAPRGGPLSRADRLNAAVPAGTQELPQGFRTRCRGG